MKDALVTLLQSKKVWTTVATWIVALAAKWGLDLPIEAVIAILANGAAVVLGIAWKDAATLNAQAKTAAVQAVAATSSLEALTAKPVYENRLDDELKEIERLGVEAPIERVAALIKKVRAVGEDAGEDVTALVAELQALVRNRLGR